MGTGAPMDEAYNDEPIDFDNFRPDPLSEASAPATSNRAGVMDDVKMEEQSESDDDEDEGKKSHIPQERRAGAGVQKKRTSGLASFAK